MENKELENKVTEDLEELTDKDMDYVSGGINHIRQIIRTGSESGKAAKGSRKKVRILTRNSSQKVWRTDKRLKTDALKSAEETSKSTRPV